MAEIRPRVLAGRLRTLASEIQRWSGTADDALQGAQREQAKVADAVHSAAKRAAASANATEELAEAVQRIQDECVRQLAIAHELQQGAADARHRGSRAQSLISDARDGWTEAHEDAQRWRERAEARLDDARRARVRAAEAVDDAVRDLDAAERALRACQSASKPQNCAGAQRRVGQAEAHLAAMSQAQAVAEAEVEDASAELTAAQQRVACTSKAVAMATDALALAGLAASAVERADSAARRGVDEMRVADTTLSRSRSSVADAGALVEQLRSNELQMTDRASAAQVAIAEARSAHRSCRSTAGGATRTLQYKADDLISFDQAEALR